MLNMKNLEFYIETLGQKEKELQEAYQNNAYKFQIERIEDDEIFQLLQSVLRRVGTQGNLANSQGTNW